jgi:hypothetical protein
MTLQADKTDTFFYNKNSAGEEVELIRIQNQEVIAPVLSCQALS